MKYLELVKGLFTNKHEDRAKQADPYVSYSIEANKLMLNLTPDPVVYDPYVTFTALEDNSSIGLNSLNINQVMEYSTDKTTWYNMDTSTTITLANLGDEVYVRGMLSDNKISYDYTQFKMSGKIAASGNCNAIWNYEDLNAPLKEYCGQQMFYMCTSLVAAPALPATELAPYCYYGMFGSCTSLTTAPALPATTLDKGCYKSMFQSCTSLTAAPVLPATELAKLCYYNMFKKCTSLIIAPELPATMLVDECYLYMFQNCTSLTTAPKLPATELAYGCYSHMFNGCTSLIAAPTILPATELAMNCYWSMFYSCTSLITAPELPATTLNDNCYARMFWGCTSLTTAPVLPATVLAYECYHSMFYDCTSLTTAPVLPATVLDAELAYGCYQYMFYNCTKLNYIKCLVTDLSVGYYTSNWVEGVPNNGTFVKHPNMTSWTTGINGIPSGWTVEDAVL